MSHRVFTEISNAPSIAIDGAEAHHVLNVLRMKVGDQLELFDGKGQSAAAVISTVSRRTVNVMVLHRQQHVRPMRPWLTIAVAPAKADRLRWMLEKLTELGVDEVVLLQTERTVVSPADTKLDKLRSNMIAACKQCGRPFLPKLGPLERMDQFLQRLAPLGAGDSAPESQSASQVPIPGIVIAHPGQLLIRPESFCRDRANVLLIGPEGGFTDAEVQLAIRHNAQPAGWPDSILRIETAAVAFCTLALTATCPTSN